MKINLYVFVFFFLEFRVNFWFWEYFEVEFIKYLNMFYIFLEIYIIFMF